MNNLKALLFDIDGTLISLTPAIKSIQDTCKKFNYRILSEKEIKQKIISTPLAESIQKLQGITKEEAENFYQEHHKNLSKNYKPLLLNNSKGVIDYFKKQGYKIGMVTTKRRKSAEEVIEKTNLTYDSLITSEDCNERKPSPSPILKACKELEAKPEETAVIGDHIYDIIAGKKAGCMTIAITTGVKTKEELEKHEPDYIINDLNELKKIIQKKLFNDKIFRAYDIRGKYPEDFTEDFAEELGKAYAKYIKEKEVYVGKDARLSSEKLFKSLAKGINSQGVDVIDIGLVPSPVLYFAVRTENKKAGVMITASHNPPEYNGFKLSNGKYAVVSEEIQKIKEMIEKQGAEKTREEGKIIKNKGILEKYKKFMIKSIKLEKPLKVVIDSANGTCGTIAPSIFREKGCEVIELYSKPDGSFPNHPPDPQPIENRKALAEKVIETKADLGIAYDGDGDRVAFVDDKGKPLTGDEAFIVFIRDILSEKKGTIVYEGKTSKAVIEEIEKNKGKGKLTKTGNPSIRKAVLDNNALLGGEIGGHFYFNDNYFGYDDGIYSSLRMAEIISRGKKLSELTKEIPKYYTSPEIRIKCSAEKQEKAIEKIKKDYAKEKLVLIDGVRVEMKNSWFLVRKSNTEEALTIRIESKSEEELEKLKNEVEEKIKEAIE